MGTTGSFLLWAAKIWLTAVWGRMGSFELCFHVFSLCIIPMITSHTDLTLSARHSTGAYLYRSIVGQNIDSTHNEFKVVIPVGIK